MRQSHPYQFVRIDRQGPADSKMSKLQTNLAGERNGEWTVERRGGRTERVACMCKVIKSACARNGIQEGPSDTPPYMICPQIKGSEEAQTVGILWRIARPPVDGAIHRLIKPKIRSRFLSKPIGFETMPSLCTLCLGPLPPRLLSIVKQAASIHTRPVTGEKKVLSKHESHSSIGPRLPRDAWQSAAYVRCRPAQALSWTVPNTTISTRAVNRATSRLLLEK